VRASYLAALSLLPALVVGHAPAGAEVRVFVTNEKSDDVTVIDSTWTLLVAARPPARE